MSIAEIPPWDGPDLLADVKAAALVAGSSGTKEATWADFEVKPAVAQETIVKLPMRIRLTRSVTPRDASGGYISVATAVPEEAPVRSEAESEWWIKLKAQNAVTAAKAATEREAKKLEAKRKAALKRGSLGLKLGRDRKPRGRGAVRASGAVTLNSNGQPRKRRTTMTPELSAVIAADTGTIAQLAERHGVSAGAVQVVRARAGSHPKQRLTAQQVIEIWKSLDSAAVLARRYQVSDAAVSLIRTGKSWAHLTSQLGPIANAVKPRVAKANGAESKRVHLSPLSMAALMADTGTHGQLSAKYGVSISTVRRARARAKGGMTTI
jgi:hypothetical protein